MPNYDAIIYVLALVMLFAGWFPTYIMYRREKVRIARIHKFEQDQTFFSAFKSGWDAGYEARKTAERWEKLESSKDNAQK